MPVRVDDINRSGVINPFGVVRSLLDLGPARADFVNRFNTMLHTDSRFIAA